MLLPQGQVAVRGVVLEGLGPVGQMRVVGRGVAWQEEWRRNSLGMDHVVEGSDRVEGGDARRSTGSAEVSG